MNLLALPKLPEIKPVPGEGFTVGGILTQIIGWFLFVAGAIAVIYLILAGYQYITAAGDPEKATKAKNAIIYAVIGIVVIVLSYVIVTTVASEAGKNPPQSSQQQQDQGSGGGSGGSLPF